MKILALAVLAVLTGCVSAAEHRAAVSNPVSDRVTVGTVQREIKQGMSSADVAQILGSPNMVTTDEKRREVWVYDKISTEVSVSSSGMSIGGIGGIGAPIGSAGVLGGIGGGYNNSAGAASTSQRTLTIIIKFDENQKVRDYSYRTSSF